MKKTAPTDPKQKLATCLLYILATAAVFLSGLPVIMVVLVLLTLMTSLVLWWLSDTAIDILLLDDDQVLLITAQGRWIPVEITALYYSGLGQVLICQALRPAFASPLKNNGYHLVDFLPGGRRVAELRQQRCLGLARLTDRSGGSHCDRRG